MTWKNDRYKHNMAAKGVKTKYNPNRIAYNIIKALPDERFIREQMKQLEGETAYIWDGSMHEIEIEIGEVVNPFEGTFRVYDGYNKGGFIVKISDLHFEKEDV